MNINMKKKESIKELIEKSGNNFHYEVVKFLRNKEWTVLISPYYNDNISDKPREIDIIAEKKFDIKDDFGYAWIATLNVRLFIECKYISKPVALWFDKKDKEMATKRVIKDIPIQNSEEYVLSL